MKDYGIINSDHEKFMESNVTPSIKRIIKEICHKLYTETNKQVNYIEIGIWYGGTFKEILQDCKDIDLHGIGIDFFEDFVKLNKDELNTHVAPTITLESAIKKYKEEGFSNFTLIKGNSVDVLKSLEKLENVVCLIDGNHTYNAVKNDFETVKNITINGYIILDDCNYWEDPNGEYGIFKFFNEIKNQYRIVYQDVRNVVFKL
jgi:hypothetical protein